MQWYAPRTVFYALLIKDASLTPAFMSKKAYGMHQNLRSSVTPYLRGRQDDMDVLATLGKLQDRRCQAP